MIAMFCVEFLERILFFSTCFTVVKAAPASRRSVRATRYEQIAAVAAAASSVWRKWLRADKTLAGGVNQCWISHSSQFPSPSMSFNSTEWKGIRAGLCKQRETEVSEKYRKSRLFGNNFKIQMQRLQQRTELGSQQILYTISRNCTNTYLWRSDHSYAHVCC